MMRIAMFVGMFGIGVASLATADDRTSSNPMNDPARAGSPTTVPPTTSAPPASVQSEVQGKVTHFDRDSNLITLSGSDKALHVDSSTEVIKNGGKMSIADIKEGDEVRASYSGTGDTLHVEKLELMGMGASPSPGSTPPTGSGTGTMGAPSDTTTPMGDTSTGKEKVKEKSEKSEKKEKKTY
jgi:hypothetical protein